MRNAFIEELLIAAETNKNIVLVVADLGYGVIEPFAKPILRLCFPGRKMIIHNLPCFGSTS